MKEPMIDLKEEINQTKGDLKYLKNRVQIHEL